MWTSLLSIKVRVIPKYIADSETEMCRKKYKVNKRSVFSYISGEVNVRLW